MPRHKKTALFAVAALLLLMLSGVAAAGASTHAKNVELEQAMAGLPAAQGGGSSSSSSDGGGGTALPAPSASHDALGDEEEERRAPMSTDAVFRPTHEWQQLRPDQGVPPGLHVKMNMATGNKIARYVEGTPEFEESKKAAAAAAAATDGEGHEEQQRYAEHVLRELNKQVLAQDVVQVIRTHLTTLRNEDGDVTTDQAIHAVLQLRDMLSSYDDAVVWAGPAMGGLDMAMEFLRRGVSAPMEPSGFVTPSEPDEELEYLYDASTAADMAKWGASLIGTAAGNNRDVKAMVDVKGLASLLHTCYRSGAEELKSGQVSPTMLQNPLVATNIELQDSLVRALSAVMRSNAVAQEDFMESGPDAVGTLHGLVRGGDDKAGPKFDFECGDSMCGNYCMDMQDMHREWLTLRQRLALRALRLASDLTADALINTQAMHESEPWLSSSSSSSPQPNEEDASEEKEGSQKAFHHEHVAKSSSSHAPLAQAVVNQHFCELYQQLLGALTDQEHRPSQRIVDEVRNLIDMFRNEDAYSQAPGVDPTVSLNAKTCADLLSRGLRNEKDEL